MGEDTKIQWAQNTWNPWHGCKKVSAGCKFCYMYRDKEKYGQDPTIVVRSKTKFKEPLKWLEPRLIFTCSWSDWFIDEADEWRPEAWEIIKATPHHTYQILTKRPERILDHLPPDWGTGYPNVWLGISVEDQAALRERVPLLSRVPARVRFLSCEPLLEVFSFAMLKGFFAHFYFSQDFHWVIVGGESGNDNGKYLYRPCELAWIEMIVLECTTLYNIPVFVKQLGTHLAKQLKLKDRHGGNIEEWPEHLRIRQMPNK